MDPLNGQQEYGDSSPQLPWWDADFSKMQKVAIALCMTMAFIGLMIFTGGLFALLGLTMLELGVFSWLLGLVITAGAYYGAKDLGKIAAGNTPDEYKKWTQKNH